MTKEQEFHRDENARVFRDLYKVKYTAGQVNHGGNMWQMGAYQALENAEEECLDNWSYLRQIRKCLDEIRDVCDEHFRTTETTARLMTNVEKVEEIKQILNRLKDDNYKPEIEPQNIPYEVVE